MLISMLLYSPFFSRIPAIAPFESLIYARIVESDHASILLIFPHDRQGNVPECQIRIFIGSLVEFACQMQQDLTFWKLLLTIVKIRVR